MTPIDVRPITLAEQPDATGLLAHLNPDCPIPVLLERFRRILKDHPHYLPIGAFRGEKMVGFAGAWSWAVDSGASRASTIRACSLRIEGNSK